MYRRSLFFILVFLALFGLNQEARAYTCRWDLIAKPEPHDMSIPALKEYIDRAFEKRDDEQAAHLAHGTICRASITPNDLGPVHRAKLKYLSVITARKEAANIRGLIDDGCIVAADYNLKNLEALLWWYTDATSIVPTYNAMRAEVDERIKTVDWAAAKRHPWGPLLHCSRTR